VATSRQNGKMRRSPPQKNAGPSRASEKNTTGSGERGSENTRKYKTLVHGGAKKDMPRAPLTVAPQIKKTKKKSLEIGGPKEGKKRKGKEKSSLPQTIQWRKGTIKPRKNRCKAVS